MFGSLKEKLKGWLGKNDYETKTKITTPKKKKKKETNKKITKKKPGKKKTKKKISSPTKNLEKKLIKKEVFEEEVEEVNLIEEEPKEETNTKKGLFSLFKKELTKEKFDDMFEELEIILLQSNVALEAIDAIRLSLEKDLIGESSKKIDLPTSLKHAIEKLLIEPKNFVKEIKESLKEKKPYVIVFSGINGSGKTTTIAKVAHYLLKEKMSVCLAAADTFRAAALEQIQQHADALKIPLIKKDYGTDPAAVGFDAITYAQKHNIDVVLIDTAGRMQNKDSLMREMEKIVRVTKPNKKIFLGESITGNDATQQAKAFNETISLDGIILSKADVDEKGGTAISVSHVTGKPILFLGTGQTYDDLEIFDKEKLIEKLGL